MQENGRSRTTGILGSGPSKAVADIGAGAGWFTARAAKRVGDTGTMYAVDINPEAIRYIWVQGAEREPVQRQAEIGQAW
jgi:ubiquinone/menaquinone biosynthesis C-methylase UbiE